MSKLKISKSKPQQARRRLRREIIIGKKATNTSIAANKTVLDLDNTIKTRADKGMNSMLIGGKVFLKS